MLNRAELYFSAAARRGADSPHFGSRFELHDLPKNAAIPDPSPFFVKHVPSPHGVVTQHLIDRDGEPTIAARDEIIVYLQDRLGVSALG